jgi:hypothetical protein
MVTTSVTQVKLGKLPARVDPRTLSLGRYVDREVLPAPPPVLDLSERVGEWPMYANDRVGDCTTAAAGHMIEAWTAAAAGAAVEVPEAAVLAAFDEVKVVDPASGEEGAVELDVLKLWRTGGIGGHRIGAFARVAPDDRDLVSTGARLFGGFYIGQPGARSTRDGTGRAASTAPTPRDRGAGTPSTLSGTARPA